MNLPVLDIIHPSVDEELELLLVKLWVHQRFAVGEEEAVGIRIPQ